MEPHPPSFYAFNSLDDKQKEFLFSLPRRIELHAHLNGSIPLNTLQSLAVDYCNIDNNNNNNEIIRNAIKNFEKGIKLEKINDFFQLFPSIYALTSTKQAIEYVTTSVLETFLVPQSPYSKPQATDLELRSTPRAVQDTGMTRSQYVEAVCNGIDKIESMLGRKCVGLILSIDRRMKSEDAEEIVDLAINCNHVVGVDLCGDMYSGNDVRKLIPALSRVKRAGLGLTMHIYETSPRSQEEENVEWDLLQLEPNRLGHATFLSKRAFDFVYDKKSCIELCLSSNIMCRTANTLQEHHINSLFKTRHNVPFAICTDDPLPFRTQLVSEYAILLAQPPYGLGYNEELVREIADSAYNSKFKFRR